jgi:hypothetical protein
VKEESGHLLADSHSIINKWKHYFCQLLNVHTVSEVRQTEVHMAEPLMPDLSPFKVEIVIARLKEYKSPGSKIVAQLIQAEGKTVPSEIHKLIHSIWNEEVLPTSGRSLLLYQFTRTVIKLTVMINMGYYWYQFHTKLYPIFFFQG